MLGRSFLTKEEAEKTVMAFKPQQFPFEPTQNAKNFVKAQSQLENPPFKVHQSVAVTTGIGDLERLSLTERVEAEALERLQSLQEDAYKQGYDLGRDEGARSAYEEKKKELEEQMAHFRHLIGSLEVLKTQLVNHNERGLVAMAFQIGRRLALKEIEFDQQVIGRLLADLAQALQDEESLTLKVSPKDAEFLESHKENKGTESEFLLKSRIEADETVAPGGCIIATNYGQIDASITQRIEKLWQALDQVLPKHQDEFASKPTGDGSSS